MTRVPDLRQDRGRLGRPAQRPLLGVRVLVVGINFWPETTGIAPYTTAVARHLQDCGAGVTVVTGMPHYPQWQVAQGYGRLLSSERLGGVRVLRAGHYVPEQMDAVRRGLFEASWLPGAAAQVLRTRADVVLAVSPALGALPLARAYAAVHGVPWAAVVQDLVGVAAERSGVRGGGVVAGAVDTVELSHLRAADRVAVIGSGFAKQLVARGVCEPRVRVLPNWSHIQPVDLSPSEARRRLGWSQRGFTVVHTGNMGAKQGLNNVVDAALVAGRRGVDVQFVLVGDGSERRHLAVRAEGLANLRVVAPVEEARYPLVLAAADALLVNERPGMVEMSLPSKVTSYLVAGRPLVAAVPEGGWTADLLRDSGAAVCVPPGDPSALVDVVQELSGAPERCAQLAARGRRYAETSCDAHGGLGRYVELVRELLSLPTARRHRLTGRSPAHSRGRGGASSPTP